MTKKALREKKKDARTMFLVKVGVYFAYLTGVIVQYGFKRLDFQTLTLDYDFAGMNIARIGLAVGIATYMYVRYRKKGELDRKVKYVWSIIGVAFAKGFTVMGLAGIGEGF